MVSAQSLSLLVFVHESITFQKNKNSRKKLSFTFQFWQKICFTIFSQCSYTFQKKLVWKFWTFEILHQQIYPFLSLSCLFIQFEDECKSGSKNKWNSSSFLRGFFFFSNNNWIFEIAQNKNYQSFWNFFLNIIFFLNFHL
jgi:hypothetical protein